MQNKIKWKNYFKIQTSSFSVKHLQTRNIAIRFLPPRDGEDETDLYAQRISRRIVCKRKKKKKGKSRAREGTRSCYRTFPRPTFSSARRKPRALSSFLDSWNEYSRFPQVRSMHALEIDYIGHALRLKPLKQGTLLITCYPAVYDQRSPRKIFGKRIETYTSDTLSKRHCVAVYLPSVAYSRGGEDVRWKEREKKRERRNRETGIWAVEVDRLGRWRTHVPRLVLMDRRVARWVFGHATA